MQLHFLNYNKKSRKKSSNIQAPSDHEMDEEEEDRADSPDDNRGTCMALVQLPNRLISAGLEPVLSYTV